jgi:hypothetical protein
MRAVGWFRIRRRYELDEGDRSNGGRYIFPHFIGTQILYEVQVIVSCSGRNVVFLLRLRLCDFCGEDMFTLAERRGAFFTLPGVSSHALGVAEELILERGGWRLHFLRHTASCYRANF